MKFGYIDEARKNEWEALVAQNPASGYMQSFFWTEFITALGWKTYKIGIFDKGKLIGGAIVGKYDHFKDRNFLVIPDGPVLPYSSKRSLIMFEKLVSEIDSIADLTGKKLSSHLHIEPRLQNVPTYFKRFKKSLRDIQPIKTLVIDLTKTEDESLQGMKPKGRYNIKIAQKYGVKIVTGSPNESIAEFLKLYKSFAKTRSMDAKDDGYFYSLASILEKYNCGRIYFIHYASQHARREGIRCCLCRSYLFLPCPNLYYRCRWFYPLYFRIVGCGD